MQLWINRMVLAAQKTSFMEFVKISQQKISCICCTKFRELSFVRNEISFELLPWMDEQPNSRRRMCKTPKQQKVNVIFLLNYSMKSSFNTLL